jgi:hypothetical protein
MCFQSFFMLITIQPLVFDLVIRASEKVPNVSVRNKSVRVSALRNVVTDERCEHQKTWRRPSIGLRSHLVQDQLNVERCGFLTLWEFLEGLEKLSHDYLRGHHDP